MYTQHVHVTGPIPTGDTPPEPKHIKNGLGFHERQSHTGGVKASFDAVIKSSQRTTAKGGRARNRSRTSQGRGLCSAKSLPNPSAPAAAAPATDAPASMHMLQMHLLLHTILQLR